MYLFPFENVSQTRESRKFPIKLFSILRRHVGTPAEILETDMKARI